MDSAYLPPGEMQRSTEASIPSKKQICVQCRNRKVRCDGRYVGCSNCSRLGFDCSLRSLQAGDQQSTHRSPPKRARISRACMKCHAMKSRCNGNSPKCERCEAKGAVCIYPQRRSRHCQPEFSENEGCSQTSSLEEPVDMDRPYFSPQFAPALLSSQSGDNNHSGIWLDQRSTLLAPDRITSAIRTFFRHLHCLPSLAFLHKTSLLRLHFEGQADQALLASIVAVTSLLPGSSMSEREIGSRCATLAENMILNELIRPSIFKVQALLLIIRFRIWTGSHENAFLLMAPLTRSAFALRINYETFKPSFFIQESRRRLMWAIYILDSMISCGLLEHTLCPIDAIHIRLPCAEDDFELNNETNVEYIGHNGAASMRLGILAYYMRVINLYDEVVRYTEQASRSKADFGTLSSTSQNLEKSLETFASTLPEGEQYSQKNLDLRAFSPRLPRFIMAHVWWHHCHCQLFRGMVSNLSPTLPEKYLGHLGMDIVLDNQAKCLRHAHSISTIFSSLIAIEGDTWTLEYEMAGCAHAATEILLTCDATIRDHIDLTREQVVDDVTACLQLIQRLQQMYPAVFSMAADIEQGLLQFSQELPIQSKMSTMKEIAPHQVVPRHSVLGGTSFMDDSQKLEMAAPPKAHERSSTADALRIDQNMTSPTNTGAEHIGRETLPQDSILWTTERDQTLPDLESVSNIWDQISLFQDPFQNLDHGSMM